MKTTTHCIGHIVLDAILSSEMYFFYLECKITSRNCLIELLNFWG